MIPKRQRTQSTAKADVASRGRSRTTKHLAPPDKPAAVPPASDASLSVVVSDLGVAHARAKNRQVRLEFVVIVVMFPNQSTGSLERNWFPLSVRTALQGGLTEQVNKLKSS